ncbi:hypothetical protein RhiirC2_800888 [Rhizophagus irregularis]|uniref:Uncharacterized protein n=1 Tax=Rhizophagus irregularis TaxID=588596 RepID=A0A2N1M301_9GLOM|nr:hypothetical protein RhiirC2_800888 [Rhizophagus irregularis]
MVSLNFNFNCIFHDEVLRYTTLNDDFTKRLKDENRYQDNKDVGDKRPILESPSPPERKPWLVMDEGDSSSEDEGMKEEAEKQMKKEENEEASPNSTPTKKKKKKKKKNKK